MSSSGKCLCGAVTFTAETVDSHVHACHCTMCRNWSGGPLLAAQASGVTFSGEASLKTYKSSEWAERGFCSECGTSLYYRMSGADEFILCTGSFDDAEQFALAGEIYIDEKPSSYAFAGDHPRMTGQEFMASLGIEVPPS